MNTSVSISKVDGWYATMSPSEIDPSTYFSGNAAYVKGGISLASAAGLGSQVSLVDPPPGSTSLPIVNGFDVHTTIGIGLAKGSCAISKSWLLPVFAILEYESGEHENGQDEEHVHGR